MNWKVKMEQPDKFKLLYNCKIKDTGLKLQSAPNMAMRAYLDLDLDMPQSEMTVIKEEPIIAIEMPLSEYNRFLNNWNNYMTLMDVGLNDMHIRHELEKLITWAKLKK